MISTTSIHHETPRSARVNRRRLLQLGLACAMTSALPAWAKVPQTRALAFDHLHTGEQLEIIYFEQGQYDDGALAAINRLLRDFRTGDVHPIRTELLDQLSLVHAAAGSDAPFQIISAYRSAKTNGMLQRKSSGVASRSLHMDGMAIDVRLPDVKTHHLRDVAADLRLGGVGYYAQSNFVHLDIGRPRQW
ncbi:MAG: DUF882 domain-containing protein [Gammaproteobacteria bacterium]